MGRCAKLNGMHTAGPHAPRRRAYLRGRAAIVAAVVIAGAAWRLFLMGRYAGWEESDYGNLAMVRGVLDGGFAHYDMNHMPGYYALGALALAAVGDAVVAARGVSMLGGLAALGLAVALTDRLYGRVAATIAGLLLIFQPEFALYASSSLREPVYAAFVLGCLTALASERMALAGLAASAAFLVRFDGALALAPAIFVHALGRPRAGRRVGAAALPMAVTVAAWSAYCQWDHGTWRFWEHAVAVNVETGLGAEAVGPAGWALAGGAVALALVAGMLPGRVGWGVWAGLLPAVWAVPWRRHDARRTWAVAAVCMVGVWAGIGFTAQHDPDHNLYWKWLCPVIPVIVPLGVVGVLIVASRLRRAGRVAVALVVVQALAAGLIETKRQVDLSNDWYRPQLDLARWIEAEVPEGVPLLVDNIPACWINRRPNERRMTSWFDVPVSPGDEAAFAAWLTAEQIGWVLTFREDWTQAPVVAPFLGAGGTWEEGGVRLVERSREDGYGWIFYEVVPVDGAGKPRGPP